MAGSLYHVDRGVLKAYGVASGQSSEVTELAANKKGKLHVTALLHSLKQGVIVVFFHSRGTKGISATTAADDTSELQRKA